MAVLVILVGTHSTFPMLTASLLVAAAGTASAATYRYTPSVPSAQTFNLTLLTDAALNEGAVCLDGSPAAFYWHSGAETEKFYIHQGEDVC